MKRGFVLVILTLGVTSLSWSARRPVMAETVTATLVRWPYLQRITHDSARITWATNFKGSPVLLYAQGGSATGLTNGVVSRSVSTPDGAYYEHQVVLAGLKPQTWYWYQIFDGAANLTPNEKRWFETAPASGDFSFLAFGDSGSGSTFQHQLRDQMLLRWRDVQLFIHTGDLAYPDGSYAEFQAYYFDVYRELLAYRPFFPTIGNHEYVTDDAGPYLDLFDLPITDGWDWDLRDVEKYYAFDWGDVHFVSLDSEGPLYRISDTRANDMADWLIHDLSNDDHFWKIVVIHRPPYSSSPVHPETDVRTKLAPIFETYGVDLVLSGHNHNYERSFPIRDGQVTTVDGGGVVYVVTGGGGGTLYPVPGDWFTAARAQEYHFVQVDVTACVLTLTAIDYQGNEIDRATLEKCPFDLYFPYLGVD